MNTRALLSLVLALACAAPAGAAPAVVSHDDGSSRQLGSPGGDAGSACVLVACAPVSDAVSSRALPDVGALARASSVSGALAAVAPWARPRSLEARPLETEIAWLGSLAGDGSAVVPSLDARMRRALATTIAGLRSALEDQRRAVSPGTARRALDLLSTVPAASSGTLADYPELRSLAAQVDAAALARAAATLAATADEARAAADGGVVGSCEGDLSDPIEIGDRIAVDPLGARTLYAKPYAVIVDLGGCDEYRAAVAGADGLRSFPAGAVVDLGPGDDYYANVKDTYSLGGAAAGVALLLDAGGNDRYDATGYAPLGGGIVGAAVSADLGGDDLYDYRNSGGGFGASGIGAIGFGAQIDLGGGDDLYSYEFDTGDADLPSGFSRLLSGQGAASAGTGILADAGGDDRYQIVARGNTMSAQGQGVATLAAYGALVDASGDDHYAIEVRLASTVAGASGGVTGQGVGAFDGLGILLDSEGDDAYTLRAVADSATAASASGIGQGFGMGALQWVGLGALVEGGGDDVYTLSADALAPDPARTFSAVRGQAVGLWLGAGALVDRDGDDSYLLTGADRAGQGAAFAAAAALLADGGGNDSYAAGPRAQGYGGQADFGDGFVIPGGVAGFIDGGGRNSYAGTGARGFAWSHGDNGFGQGVDLGAAGAHVLGVADFFVALFGMGRPRPLPTVSITAPADESSVSGATTMTGTADAGGAPVGAVEWRLDGGPWRLARKHGSWATWSADVGTLSPGTHRLEARAWAAGVDSDVAVARVTAV